MIRPKLLRPCPEALYPDGAQFGQWGPMWGSHFDENGKWTKGKVLHDGKMVGQHSGKDIIVPIGVLQVVPFDTEKVLKAGWQNASDQKEGYGLRAQFLTTPIEWSEGKWDRLILTLAHLSEIWVTESHHLARGDAFGKSGNTGNSSGPHIHTDLRLPDGTPIDFEWINHY